MLLQAFYPFILPEVMGCPQPVVDAHVVAAATRLCQDTMAWTTTEQQTLMAGVAEYELNVQPQAYALTVRDVWVGGQRLRPATMLELAASQWDGQAAGQPAFYNASVVRGGIKVFPMPNQTQSMTLRVAYAPVVGADSLPDFLGQRYMDVVCAGAKASLMLMTAQAWGNPQLAAFFQQRFMDGINEIKVAEIHDRVPGTVMVQPRSFGF